MPSRSKSEHKWWGMASTPKGRAKLRAEGKKVPPLATAKEFLQADKGKVGSMSERVTPKKRGKR